MGSVEINILTKKMSNSYADYADDTPLLANTPVQIETLLHSLEPTAAGIGLHVNADETEYMYFSQRSDISTLNASSLKQMDKYTYLGSSIFIHREIHQHKTNKGMDRNR